MLGPPEIKPQDIWYDETNDLLGIGSYGKVFKGRCRGQEVAVKVPHKQNLSLEELASFQREVHMMSKNSHPNIIMLMGACIEEGKLQIVTEKCRTDLESVLQQQLQLSRFSLLKMARDAAMGMSWLHEITKIIHRDLKPANLLIDANGHVKVSDFGFCQVKTNTLRTDKPKGSLLWMAPEVMQGKPYSEKIDVYSFGIILWEIVTREKPFAHHNDPVEFCNAVVHRNERPPLQPSIPESLRILISNCWDANPDARLSFRVVVLKLNEILVDHAIENPDAAAMWKKYFLYPGETLQEKVEWPDFEKHLLQELRAKTMATLSFAHLQVLLLDTVEDVGKKQFVTMARVDKVVKWFGPFFDPGEGLNVIAQINKLMDSSWFHGDINQLKADQSLIGEPQDTFLIRLSYSDPVKNPFTLSIPGKRHYRIERVNGGLKVQNVVFKDIYEIVERYGGEKRACPKKPDGVY